MRLGEIIKRFRFENDITQQAFANDCGVSKSYISLIENGKTSRANTEAVPSVEIMRKFATRMGLTMDELLSMVDAKQPIKINKDNRISQDLQLACLWIHQSHCHMNIGSATNSTAHIYPFYRCG